MLTNWLDAYLKYTFDSEPPQSYHIWVGMGLLAGALQRKVYYKHGRQIIYPNLYIVLVGPSGHSKKGTALDYGIPIIKGAKVRVIQGAITREKLIRRMAGAVSNYTDATDGQIKFQCAVTCISDELSVFLGQNNIKFLADLCNWYDCPPDWKYDTKNMGTDTLDGVCFNLIGATAPDWLPTILPREAVGGGFTSRVIWVVEEGKGKTVVYPTVDEDLEAALIRDLEQISLISGEFKFSSSAESWYESWYTKEEEAARDGRFPIMHPKMAGYCSRRATLIKKIAMIMAMCEGSKLIISQEHFEKALLYLEPIEKKMSRMTGGMGSARYAYATELMLNYIMKQKVVTRTQILRFLFRDIDEWTFEIVTRTLEKMDIVKVDRNIAKNEVVLTLNESAARDLVW